MFESKRKIEKMQKEMQNEIGYLNHKLSEAKSEITQLKSMIPEAEEFCFSYECNYCKHCRRNGSAVLCELTPHKCKHFE